MNVKSQDVAGSVVRRLAETQSLVRQSSSLLREQSTHSNYTAGILQWRSVDSHPIMPLEIKLHFCKAPRKKKRKNTGTFIWLFRVRKMQQMKLNQVS